MTDRLGALSILAASIAFVACLTGWLAGGGAIDVPWAPARDLRLNFALDGLGALYALLATGIGAAVFVFGAGYLPIHLAHEQRPGGDAWRFWPWMVLFMVAMVGLAFARDLVLLFVFFDLTAVSSYFLIGFDRDKRDARGSALMALLVTGIGAVGMLFGAVLLYVEYGTFSLPELFALARPGPVTIAASALIVTAALAKSAQVPLHFWLPRAMAAPTPVSAYLHSAAMVAAGVLVLGRTHPLLATNQVVLDGLLVVGMASILVGGLLALAHDELKQILAYSTISQYGYVVALYGMGSEVAAGAAALYVIAHGVAKSALFMTAGAVTTATGASRLSELGGLLRRMPTVGAASAVAAAALSALPLTIGFFKDELFFAAAIEAGPGVQALAVVAAALTFAYIGRFWFGLFTGNARTEAAAVPALMVAPIAVLAVIAALGGVVVDPFAQLAARAGAVTHGAPVEIAPAYHLDLRPENLMAVAAWALGGLLLLARPVRERAVGMVNAGGAKVGPRRWYAAALVALNGFSDRLHTMEVHSLRTSLVAVLVPTGLLTAAGVAVTLTRSSYELGEVTVRDLPLIALLALAVAAALTVARDPGRLRPVLAMSVIGFALAGVYAMVGAPDVALVAVVIETIVTLVFVAIFARLPPTTHAVAGAAHERRDRRRRNRLAGVVAGAGAFAVIWAALSLPVVPGSDATRQTELTPAAHGSDVVTVILADFRGFDTLVEITVLAVAVVGVATLLRQGRLW